ncbi:MAG: PAS domain-containing protein, partial [Candidatus Bipolaricaulota bacterium]|nr:PAS domain-containing protein [Candidatus Bipolaricaulota bacterium]
QSGSQEYKLDDTPYYGSYVTLESNGWGVVTTTPMHVILARSNLLTRQLLLVNVALFVIAIAITLVFTGQITGQRKQMEEKLKAARERLELAIDAAEHGFWDWNLDTDDIYFSPRYYTMLGYEPGELPMRLETWVDLMHPEDRETIVPQVQEYVKNAQPYEVEFRLRTKDGGWRWISGRGKSFEKDEQGVPHRAVGVHVDITERVHAEEETRELEAQLRQGQKLESIGTLASGVAHEINNPLTGMINYADLIESRTDSAELKKFATGIIKEGNRVAQIVKDLLDFSRQEKQSHSPARLEDIINASLNLVGAALRKDQITIEKDIPDDLPQVRCRSQQIEQVIINLLTNARDSLNQRYKGYHENKLVRIIVQSFEKDDVEWIRTTIEDHGAGIAEDVIEHIFDPFFTTKPRDEGTGLGLSVSYGIIKDHHGELTVESEPGKYTRFHLDLRVDNGWSLE